ncbi:MAG: hypothetical protein FAZ92_01605 [Accumulibacter sp.]|jgi:hypothetical protein|nr:MAG: hypothetical protein FAZ92_01605 [Accumulibacter sp.]
MCGHRAGNRSFCQVIAVTVVPPFLGDGMNLLVLAGAAALLLESADTFHQLGPLRCHGIALEKFA